MFCIVLWFSHVALKCLIQIVIFRISADRSVAAPSMSAWGVRRAKAALSSGCKSHPATAPAEINRSSHGGNEVAEAFD